MSIKKSLAAGALALALPMSVMAATDFKINGFANAGFSWTDTDEQYISTDKDGSFTENSFLGLQMRFTPNEDVPISFVTQLLAKGRNGWNLDADWAYVAWQVSEEVAVNVGRVKLPIFLISEAYDVGVTYPWIAPPEEIYGFGNVPFSSVTGLNASYNHFFDETWFAAQFFMGRDDSSIAAMGTDIDVSVSQMLGGALAFGTENLELRVSAVTVTFDMNLADSLGSLPAAQGEQARIAGDIMAASSMLALLNAAADSDPVALAALDMTTAAEAQAARPSAIAALGAASATAEDFQALFEVVPNGTGEIEFYSMGLKYDSDSVFFMTEAARRSVRGLPFPDSTSGFATFGYRFNKMMPHFTYAVHESEDSILVNQSQSSAILGLRYDIQPWAALKFEVQYTEIGDENVREYGPLVGTKLPSTGFFNEQPALDTFAGDVPDEFIKLQVAYTMVF